jgi:hypothetical protein
VEIHGAVDPRFLQGVAMRWDLGGFSGMRRVVSPSLGADLRRAELAQREDELRNNAPRTADLQMGPTAPGGSRLEQQGDTLTAKARAIRHLAQQKDDPTAWATVMNGYRVPALRAFIQDALRQIGCDKALSLARSQPDDGAAVWPDGLVDWLNAEITRETEQRRRGANVPKQYRGSDYGITDV